MNGRVRSYFESKGFGFVATDEGKDWFFHVSGIVSPEYDEWNPSIGDSVTFEPGVNPRDGRERAVKVRPV